MLSSPRIAYDVVVSSAIALDTTPGWSSVGSTPLWSRGGHDTTTPRTLDMDRELEPFIPLFPPADLSDPVTARKHLVELTRSAAAPIATDLEIENRTVPADPDVAVRIYRPERAHGAVVWMHGG